MPEEMIPDNPTPESAAAPAPAEAVDALAERVLQIIADTQRKSRSLISIDSSFEELGIDSMDGVNIVFALENEFNINVPDDEVKNIRNVRDMVEGVRKLVDDAAPSARPSSPAPSSESDAPAAS